MQKQKLKSSSRRKGRTNRRDSWEDRESRDMKRDNSKISNRTDSSTNDPKWYSTDPALLRDSSSIPFSWPLGDPIKDEYHGYGLDYSEDTTIPGICAICTMPTFGTGTRSDALNVAASQIYSFVRHTNAGHANYDPNDLMIYILAMTQVYSYVNYLERIYALSMYFDQRNRYVPESILTAMNVDYNDIKLHLADFRYQINVFINKVSALAVPATMSIFLRQAMMYAYIYAEGDSVKDQLYFYYPDGFYRFDLDSDGAGMLRYHNMRFQNTLFTVNDLISYGNYLYNSIWEQEDFGIMSGDILKSYGDNILTLKSLDEVLPFAPVYDPMVLHQMKNARGVYYDYLEPDTLNIYQNAAKSKLEHTIWLRRTNTKGINVGTSMSIELDKVLSIDSVSPTPEMVIESTRLTCTGESGTYQAEENTYLVAGSEIPVLLRLCSRNSNGSLDIHEMGFWSGNAPTSVEFALLKAYKFAPEYIGVKLDDYTNPTAITGCIHVREVDNFAVLNRSDLEKMHTAAILNMLNVPSPAKNVRV